MGWGWKPSSPSIIRASPSSFRQGAEQTDSGPSPVKLGLSIFSSSNAIRPCEEVYTLSRPGEGVELEFNKREGANEPAVSWRRRGLLCI